MLWMTLAMAGPPPEGSPFEVPFFHHGSLKANKRVDPVYPDVEDADRRVRHRCMVWVEIGTDGRPQQVKIQPAFAGEGCTAPYQAAAIAAVEQWKWKPKKIGKEKSVVQTTITRVFLSQPMEPRVDTSREGSPMPEPVKQPKRPQ